MPQQKKRSKATTKRTTKRRGKKNITSTATSFGYGGKSQTTVRLKRARRKLIAPYQSKYEYEIAQDLLKRGIAFEYEPKQIPYIYPVRKGTCNDCGSVNVGRLAIYTPDFWLPELELWVEAKGRWDGSGRTKILAVLETSEVIHRDNFKMLFMYDNWITKKHKLTYTGWCQKHQILSDVGNTLPKDWL